jgi:hypothetical protein
MRFSVVFTGTGDKRASIYTPVKCIGTDVVVQIRRELVGEDISIDLISCTIDEIHTNVHISVTEEKALTIPGFKKNNTIYVKTRDGALNQFVEDKISVDRNGVTGEIEDVEIVPIVNEEAILAAWIADGCPGSDWR